jgi:multicomponent Na+:H+ antiporter subunit F
MHTGSSTLDLAYSVGFTVIPIILAIMVFFCLARAIKGPKIADRIVAINMMGTLTMVIIAVLAVKMNEGYLVDICIIYAMISFLAVTLLTKVYMGVYAERHASEIGMEKKENIENREVSHDDSATVD